MARDLVPYTGQPCPNWRQLFSDIAFVQRMPVSNLDVICEGSGYRLMRRAGHSHLQHFCFDRFAG